jgi:hypothetical protein
VDTFILLYPYKQKDRKEELDSIICTPLAIRDEIDILNVNAKMQGVTEKHKLMF